MKNIKKLVSVLLFSIVCLFFSTTVAFSQQSSGELYEKALYTEEVMGELQNAIGLYQQILENNPENKQVAAKALLHQGMCYEKLGNQEAVKKYQRVVDSFSDQTEIAALAKARLLALGSSANLNENREFIIRRVKKGTDVGFEGSVSPDGKYLSYVDWESGDLAIYEIATGNKRSLTKKGSWDNSNEFAYYSRWSPDSKQVVYDWYTAESLMELRIVGINDMIPRILYSNKDLRWSQTYGWSPDGKQILASFYYEDGQTQIVLISATNGSLRVLKTLERGWPDNMNFSPDGQYIVYDFPQENSPERDISLLSIDGTSEIPLVVHPANDKVLGWAPDGKNILFTSDRRNSLDVWVIQFLDGKVQETPKLITSNIGQVCYPKGFTQKGSFYYDIYDLANDIYFTEIDPETGKIPAPPKKLHSRFEGFLDQPEYSPDGKSIVFISNENSLSIQSLETGKMLEFSSKLSQKIISPCWSPDSRFILVGGWDWKGKKGIYRFDTQLGIFENMVLSAKMATDIFLGGYEWSNDGKAIFLVRLSSNQTLSQIMLRNIESGTEKELFRESYNFLLSCSPDGKWLAFTNMLPGGVLRIMPAIGGECRELYRFKKEGISKTLRWTPDGKYILFDQFQPSEKTYGLYRISTQGGEPQRLGLDSAFPINVSVHPDGRHIAFSTPIPKSENSGNYVMENFLPKEETVNKKK